MRFKTSWLMAGVSVGATLVALGGAQAQILAGKVSSAQEPVMEGVLVALSGKRPEELAEQDYLRFAEQIGWEELVDIIKRNVNNMADPKVAAWTDEGGPAAIDYYGGVLIVTQTPKAHERIAELLALLREGLARVERQLAE
jgi:hypothetical protein